MKTIELHLDDAVYEKVRQDAVAEGRTFESLAAERIAGPSVSPPSAQDKDDPIIGLFADEPELVDQVLDDIMRSREQQRWR